MKGKVTMPGFGDLVQKAFYLGVGAASYAAEKAGTTLGELRVQAQKLADEMVARGEMTAEDAKRMVDDMVTRAQQAESAQPSEPRRIEILTDEELEFTKPQASESSESSKAAVPAPTTPSTSSQPPSQPGGMEDLRQQVAQLQEELQRLKRQ